MRRYIHINVRARLWPMAWGMMFCVGCMTLASCSSDSDVPDETPDNQLRLASVTRATDIDDGYVIQEDSKLWLALTSGSGSVPDSKGIYTLENTAWKGGVTVKEAKQYYIYGVMSPTGAITDGAVPTCTITSGDFSEGATLTIKGQPTMVEEGLVPCVVVGVRGVTDRDDASTNWDVNEGSFGYMGILKKGQDNAQLLLDRLYAALFFSFTIDEDYGNLRTIKLKTMTMTAAAGTKATVDLTVRLEARSNGTSPIASVSATAVESAGALGSITMFDNSAGMDITDLTAEKQAVATNEGGKIKSACFAPGVADGLILTCVYNVYDKAGNDLGKRTAVNSLSNVVTTGSLLHGQRRPIVLKVTPTYLYILSDEDLDNPTIKIQ
ncbi:MAG: hypothetical protein J6X07_03140 [Prevotella sp.]|nr:hypothetical protein [Prevotella sp.]